MELDLLHKRTEQSSSKTLRSTRADCVAAFGGVLVGLEWLACGWSERKWSALLRDSASAN